MDEKISNFRKHIYHKINHVSLLQTRIFEVVSTASIAQQYKQINQLDVDLPGVRPCPELHALPGAALRENKVELSKGTPFDSSTLYII